MKTFFSSPRAGGTRALGIMVVASLLWGLLSCIGASGQATTTASKEAVERVPAPVEARRREAWRMARTPRPKKGCFKAEYPNTAWQEVPCTKAPPIPMPPRRGVRPDVVGNGNNISTQGPTGFISMATGSFDSVAGLTSVSSPIGNSGTAVADAYTLQLNTNFFSSTACAGSPNPACQGWEQFVFFNDGTSGSLFIQYWLLDFNAPCPAGGLTQFSFTGSTTIFCFRNSDAAVAVPNQPITNLGQLSLSGTIDAAGDSAILSSGSTLHSVAGDNSVNAAAGWQLSEFNVFGAGGNSSGGGPGELQQWSSDRREDEGFLRRQRWSSNPDYHSKYGFGLGTLQQW